MNYHCNLICCRDVVMINIFVSPGTTNYNANVDLLYRVCNETVNCTNEDIYIRINVPEDHAKCHQMRHA